MSTTTTATVTVQRDSPPVSSIPLTTLDSPNQPISNNNNNTANTKATTTRERRTTAPNSTEPPDDPSETTTTTAAPAAQRLTGATLLKLTSTGISFFVAGVNDGSLGALIPHVLRSYGISTALVSTLYGATLAGWLFAALTATHLAQRLRLGHLLALGALLQTGAHALRCWPPAPPFGLFVFTFFMVSLGQGYQDTFGNTFVAGAFGGERKGEGGRPRAGSRESTGSTGGSREVEGLEGIEGGGGGGGGSDGPRVEGGSGRDNGTKSVHRWLGFIHAMYMAGCLVAPFGAASIAATGTGTGTGAAMGTPAEGVDSRWWLFYTVPLGLGVVNLVLVLVSFRDMLGFVGRDKGRAQTAGAAETNPKKSATSLIKDALRTRSVWLLSMFFFFYLGVVVTAGGWVVEYLVDVRNGDIAQMGYVPAGFSGGGLLGRILLPEPTHRFGEKKMVGLYCVLCLGFQLIFWL